MSDFENLSRETYDIGYKSPPGTSRFKKGQSGNPRGRPKGRKNLASILKDVSLESIQITENGQAKRISKIEGVIKQLLNKALKGDLHAIRLYVALQSRAEVIQSSSETQPIDRELDRKIVLQLLNESIAERTTDEVGESETVSE